MAWAKVIVVVRIAADRSEGPGIEDGLHAGVESSPSSSAVRMSPGFF